MTEAPAEGIVCLANDGIIDGLIALCQSLRAHSPGLPLTVIPFDANLTQTLRVAERFRYDVYDDPSLEAMDALGARYWPGDGWRPHTMRKFCAFWGPYERFLFLDADIVALRPLEPYFAAFREAPADVMYFQTDLSMVYRGGVLNEMVSQHQSVGFQTGVFMGRRGALDAHTLERLLDESRAHRHEFVDILEQTFLNYAVDVSGLSKLDVHRVVPDEVDAWAGMRLTRTRDGYAIADVRTPWSGRPVTLIHWGGYALGPFMPYRRMFLRYRLAGSGLRQRLAYRAAALTDAVRRIPQRSPGWLAYRWLTLGRNWLAARGYPAWLG